MIGRYAVTNIRIFHQISTKASAGKHLTRHRCSKKFKRVEPPNNLEVVEEVSSCIPQVPGRIEKYVLSSPTSEFYEYSEKFKNKAI